MNNLLLICGIVLTFSALVAVNRIFKASGVIGFMGFATIMANLMICKSVNLFGLSATLGNTMFASNFLATDILTECYGKKEAQKGVLFAIASSVGFLITTQIMIAFTPSEIDISQESMKVLFTLTPRVTLASVSLFAISNFVDVNLYDFMRRKSNGKRMWLRNNVSTILSNSTENFIFYIIAFAGTFSWNDLISMSVTATIIEVVIALCDTPFLYLAVRKGRKSNGSESNFSNSNNPKESRRAWS